MSTSNLNSAIHGLNGDKPLSSLKRKLYFILNRFNNAFPTLWVDDKLTQKPFVAQALEDIWHLFPVKQSPSRKLSDIFWFSLPWDKIEEELKEINILDTGCGSGGYYHILKAYSKGIINSYKGIDIYKHKEIEKKEADNKFSFGLYDGINVYREIKDNTNLFISQSAIEHFEKDLNYFLQVKEYITNSGNNVLQIHLFPAASGLKLYRIHGVRQYTPRTVSKITSLFKANSYYVLYRLGGKKCNKLHYDFITYPLKNGQKDYRETQTERYDDLLKRAIISDMKTDCQYPSFYALVIHSNYQNRIF